MWIVVSPSKFIECSSLEMTVLVYLYHVLDGVREVFTFSIDIRSKGLG
jgi:hypothetical protein